MYLAVVLCGTAVWVTQNILSKEAKIFIAVTEKGKKMDKDEILNTFHWHRWVASQKGSVTISTEDMELYWLLINKLIKANEQKRC